MPVTSTISPLQQQQTRRYSDAVNDSDDAADPEAKRHPTCHSEGNEARRGARERDRAQLIADTDTDNEDDTSFGDIEESASTSSSSSSDFGPESTLFENHPSDNDNDDDKNKDININMRLFSAKPHRTHLDDEEIGLSRKERKRRWRQNRRVLERSKRLALGSGSSEAGSMDFSRSLLGYKISDAGKKVADRKVVQALAINAGFMVLWYIFSLSISVYNKWMFDGNHLNFKFPLFTTSIHMGIQFILSFLILFFFPSLRAQPTLNADDDVGAKTLVTPRFYLARLVPCGAATCLDIGLGNMSMRFVTLTFYTMCKSSSLAFVLLFAFVFHLESPSVKLVAIIGTMTFGVIMMVAGEAIFSTFGFALVIASAFFSGFRWGLIQTLLLHHPATANPFATLFLLTPIMFFLLLCISITVEGPVAISMGLASLVSTQGLIPAALLMVFPGLLAFCMISSEFFLLKRSSVVTLSICGAFKEVVTITIANLIFHDSLTPINITGLIITLISIAVYNYIKISAMRHDARIDLAERQPHDTSPSTSAENANPNAAGGRSSGTNPLPNPSPYHNDNGNDDESRVGLLSVPDPGQMPTSSASSTTTSGTTKPTRMGQRMTSRSQGSTPPPFVRTPSLSGPRNAKAAEQ